MQSDPLSIHPNLTPASKALIREQLSGFTDHPAPQKDVAEAFRRLEIPADELRRCGGFIPGERSRHEIARCDAWVILAIFWDNTMSPIHDHEQSDCGFHVIEGEVEETRYKVIKDDIVRPIATRILQPGEMGRSRAEAIHCLGNPRKSGGQSITLHLYCPILGYDSMGIYREVDEQTIETRSALGTAKRSRSRSA